MLRKAALYTAIFVAMAGLSSCASMRGWFGGQRSTTANIEDSEVVTLDISEARRVLRDVVEEYVADAEANADNGKTHVIRKKPYFVKEYNDYPDDATTIMAIEMIETESRTSPYHAEVTLPKTRYATQLHRRRDAARADNDFIRQAGNETLSFALRSGRWHLLGSTFVADRSEQASGSIWRDTPVIDSNDEESVQQKGWFSRQWSRIFGG